MSSSLLMSSLFLMSSSFLWCSSFWDRLLYLLSYLHTLPYFIEYCSAIWPHPINIFQSSSAIRARLFIAIIVNNIIAGGYQNMEHLGKNFKGSIFWRILPSSAQAPSGLSSIILTVGHPANHPEKYNFQARAMLGSSLANWELVY